jgi:hypothetical protein
LGAAEDAEDEVGAGGFAAGCEGSDEERQEGGAAGLPVCGPVAEGRDAVSSGLEIPTRRSRVPRARTAGCMGNSFSALFFLAPMCALAYAGRTDLGYL